MTTIQAQRATQYSNQNTLFDDPNYAELFTDYNKVLEENNRLRLALDGANTIDRPLTDFNRPKELTTDELALKLINAKLRNELNQKTVELESANRQIDKLTRELKEKTLLIAAKDDQLDILTDDLGREDKRALAGKVRAQGNQLAQLSATIAEHTEQLAELTRRTSWENNLIANKSLTRPLKTFLRNLSAIILADKEHEPTDFRPIASSVLQRITGQSDNTIRNLGEQLTDLGLIQRETVSIPTTFKDGKQNFDHRTLYRLLPIALEDLSTWQPAQDSKTIKKERSEKQTKQALINLDKERKRKEDIAKQEKEVEKRRLQLEKEIKEIDQALETLASCHECGSTHTTICKDCGTIFTPNLPQFLGDNKYYTAKIEVGNAQSTACKVGGEQC